MDIANIKNPHYSLGAPTNWDHDAVPCASLPIKFENIGGYRAMSSFWKPTAEELRILSEGGCVKLSVLNATHPVVAMSAEHVELKSTH